MELPYEDLSRVSFGTVADNRPAIDGIGRGDGPDPGVFDPGHCFHVRRSGGALRVGTAGASLAVSREVTTRLTNWSTFGAFQVLKL
jgi:hypothetical protein